ncbi:MAG: hypothetical protein ACOY71_04630 [Gemmatimonadota bacterium]
MNNFLREGFVLAEDLRFSHNHFHHVHCFDTFGSGHETGCVRIDTEDKRPTISDVLNELQDRHFENQDLLARMPGCQ